MLLRRRVILTSIAFIVISAILTFTLVMLSDYRYNEITYVGDTELQAQVIQDISIEGDYFLLTPKMLIEYRLKGLEYIKNATVQKTIPNQITITYETNTPSFCNDKWIFFENATVELTESNSSKCEGVPQIIEANEFDEFDEFVEKYEELSITFRDYVVSVEAIDNYYQFVLNTDLMIKVYLEQFEILDNYEQYRTTDNMLDLRPNYS